MLTAVEPAYEDLWFRRMMLEDEETMSYNHAWGGIVSFSEEKWNDWYDHWVIHHGTMRFYRFLKDDEGHFVGEIAYHYDSELDSFLANVIVYSKYRGRGYGAEALDLLCAGAKKNGVTTLSDDIAADNPAIGLFLKRGFKIVRRTENKIILKKEL